MIYGFDWDGTLVERWTATPLTGVREQLAALPEGTRTFIATNQAGPVWRAITGETKYPTVDDIADRIIAGLAALDWRPDVLLICVYANREGSEWIDAENVVCRELSGLLRGMNPRLVSAWACDRKPAPGMLEHARQFLHGETVDMLYIGDMESDEAAAHAAGARFMRADAWRSARISYVSTPPRTK